MSVLNTTSKKLPLQGIRVVECGHLVAGPFTGTILGYFGAEVIKIEPLNTGDQSRDYRIVDDTNTSLWWYSLGRNKHSVCVDLNTEKGRTIVKKLINQSDVFIENFRPGKMEKWKLDPLQFKESNPGLIYTRISGYGQNGPYKGKPGFASVCEAMGGFRYVNGYPDRPSVRPNLSLGDTMAGIHAALGVTLALLGKASNNNKGQVVDVAIYESMFNLLEAVVPEYHHNGTVRECSGSTITGIVPSNTYACKDNKQVIIGANMDSLYLKLMKIINKEDMGSKYPTNMARVLNQTEIDQAINDWTSRHSLSEVLAKMDEYGIPAGVIYNVQDMMHDPQYQARNMFEYVPRVNGRNTANIVVQNGDYSSDGNDNTNTNSHGNAKASDNMVCLPAISPKLMDTPGKTNWAGQRLGESTVWCLNKVLKLSEKEIKELIEDKIVADGK